MKPVKIKLLILLILPLLNCLALQNKYINKIEYFPQSNKLDVDINLTDGAELNLAILKKDQDHMFKFNFLYEGQNLIIGKRLVILIDGVEKELLVLDKSTRYHGYARSGRITERMSLKADKDLFSLIYNSHSLQLKLIGDNGVLYFELEESGRELLGNFKLESAKLFNLTY
ncbi:hypothetical protein EHQ81_00855 [Leptospira selangorensis]|uniref:Uncharacterized protein n=1 Tax=Leptospira selangorensis TaxID=2484982 RepID=A0A5F2C2F3_9LEPT|nr:hypothetical protein [Leptospira selangorensis]TGM17092.1 hypothetical protein EHQ81_00855 [Leptospira selangorensis]TGM21430.1 hypothetical protein EHQ82_10600 [Leptospira selangorensis]